MGLGLVCTIVACDQWPFGLGTERVAGCRTVNPQTVPAVDARWWKGNLHTHSLWSDGDHYPEMVADWYKTHD